MSLLIRHNRDNMTDKKSNELAVFEEIRRDIVLSKNKDIALSSVFGRGTTSELESFGGSSLAENALKVDAALKNVNELEKIWNHSHTQWIWKHINLSWLGPFNNIRQISAEIQKKKLALNDVKWKQIKAEIEISQIEEKLNKPETLDYWKEVKLKVKLAHLKEAAKDLVTAVEGAMKDVLILNELYEQCKQRMSEFSEADVEKYQSKDHLKRALVQSIRDVRMYGHITTGEQEYLEQIGVNPSKVLVLLKMYVEKEAATESWGVENLYKFVDDITEELINVHQVDKKREELQGFSTEIKEDSLYTKKLGFLSTKKDSE